MINSIVYLNNIRIFGEQLKQIGIMKTTVTFQGETLESLTGQLNYTNEALSSNLENWERKEFAAVKSEIEFKINSINERIEELKNH